MGAAVPVATRPERLRGVALVALQFSIFAAIAIPWRSWTPGVAAAVLFAAAGLLGVTTLRANRPGNFNVRPEPRASGRMVVDGPYRYVRHPMYCSLLLVAGAAVASEPLVAKAGLWIALALVLRTKAALEESLLRRVWPEYESYARTTGAFLPLRRR